MTGRSRNGFDPNALSAFNRRSFLKAGAATTALRNVCTHSGLGQERRLVSMLRLPFFSGQRPDHSCLPRPLQFARDAK